MSPLLKRLWLGCLFTHGDKVIERTADGALMFVCQRCGSIAIPNLRTPLQKGRAHVPAAVLGTPKIKARPVVTKTPNVRDFRQSSR